MVSNSSQLERHFRKAPLRNGFVLRNKNTATFPNFSGVGRTGPKKTDGKVFFSPISS